MKKLLPIALALIFALAALSYFIFRTPQSAPAEQAAGGMPAMPPLPVPMVTVAPEAASVWDQYTAKVNAVNYAQVRPQVSGEITKIAFEAGQTVAKGDVMMTIDTRALSDQYQVAQADWVLAQSALELAKNNFERAERLIASNAIAQKAFDERKAALDQAESAQALAKARVNQAKTNLNYAYVRAPFSGVVSRAEVTRGNVVQAGAGAPVLFSILSDDGLYIDFDVDAPRYLQLQAQGSDALKLHVLVPSTGQTMSATFLHFDNAVNGSSGTVRARGLIAENTLGLLPGMSVQVAMSSQNPEPVIVIPETAVGVDQSRRFVWVVDDNNVVQYRPVTLGARAESGIIVTSGLMSGDTIVADGLIKVRPNTVVMDIALMSAPNP